MNLNGVLNNLKELLSEDDNPQILKRIERIEKQLEDQRECVRQHKFKFVLNTETGDVLFEKIQAN